MNADFAKHLTEHIARLMNSGGQAWSGPSVWASTRSRPFLANEAAFDCFLLAGRYTLLEQNGLDDLLPLAEQQGFSLLIGGPFNSGILATGAAREQNTTISRRRWRFSNAWRGLTSSANVTMCHWRRQPSSFLLAIQSTASIVPGAVSPSEVERNADYVDLPIPQSLWDELKAEKLLAADARVRIILEQHRDKALKLINRLVEYGRVNAAEFLRLMNGEATQMW